MTTTAPESQAAYAELARALDRFHETDKARDQAIIALTAAAFDADPRSLVAPSTVAWAEARVKTWRETCG